MAHQAFVAKIDKIIEIPGAENIQIAKVLGEDVIVGKDMFEGFVGVFFPVDLQLSEDYCRENNLFRDSTKNKDITKKGFFDDNRRVRAQPFMKVKSCGYFSPINSLDFAMFGDATKVGFTLGETFVEINGHKICEKYVSKEAKQKIANGSQKLRKVKELPFFAKHVDSEQFKHYAERIPAGALLSFHAKVHGTSFRVAKTQVIKQLPKWKKAINKLIPMFKSEEFEYVVGSRNVVLDNPEKEGFHGKEGYRFEVMETLKPYLEDGMTVYGEIAGFVNGASIMPTHSIESLKDKAFTKKYGKEVTYTYGCANHEYRFHVYRITRQTVGGDLVDMPEKQLEKWCSDRNILGPVEVYPQVLYNGDVDKLRELVESLTERPEVLTEDYIDPTHVSEGIILRVDVDRDTPEFYKSKSFAFKCMEGLETVVDEETIS